jgi:hypothetical protein
MAPHHGYDDPPAHPLPHLGVTPKTPSRQPRSSKAALRRAVPEYIAGAVRRLAPTSETDSTRDKSDLDIATRNALSGDVFLITMNDGQLQNMT